MKNNSGVINQLWGLLVLIIAIFISRFFPDWIEHHYSEVIFPKLNSILQFFTGWITIPLFFPLIILVIYKYIKSIKLHKPSWIFIIELSLKYFLFICSFFYIFWGFNYQRLNVDRKLSLNKEAIQDSLLVYSLNETVERLDSMSIIIHTKLSNNIVEDNNELVRTSVKSVLGFLGYPSFNIGKLKAFWPKGFLLRISTAGFYLPFTGEAYYDKGLHPYQIPFALCHEFAHAQGFADEGECNFIAYLACYQSNDIIYKYSADIALYKTLKSLMLGKNYNSKLELNDLVKADLTSIRKEMEKYPDYFPQLRDNIYDLYLKLQGIKEGENNYNSFVQILIKYKKHNEIGREKR